MKKLLILTAILVAIGGGIPLFNTVSSGMTMAAFSKVEDAKPPLTANEVEKTMGQPARIESSETTGITGSVYHYPYHDHDMKIVFVNGVVFHTEFASETKS